MGGSSWDVWKALWPRLADAFSIESRVKWIAKVLAHLHLSALRNPAALR